MKIFTSFLAALLFTGFSVIAQTGPEMTFEFETHNFGELKEGDEAVVEFVFTNTGTEKLILLDVQTSCGCTTPDWPKEPILPGEKSKITVQYDTKGRVYPFNKSITISSNAVQETKRIFIKGEVVDGKTELN